MVSVQIVWVNERVQSVCDDSFQNCTECIMLALFRRMLNSDTILIC